jgi:hypothetical protein
MDCAEDCTISHRPYSDSPRTDPLCDGHHSHLSFTMGYVAFSLYIGSKNLSLGQVILSP